MLIAFSFAVFFYYFVAGITFPGLEHFVGRYKVHQSQALCLMLLMDETLSIVGKAGFFEDVS